MSRTSSYKGPGRSHKVLWVVLALLLVLVIAVAAYLNTYYPADSRAMDALAHPAPGVTVEAAGDGALAFLPDDPTAGLIFYPGGKVEYTAYAPLMEACAQKGVLCVLVKMPFNLAVFDPNAADGIQEQYPQVTDWYMGGHSLGGVMAGSYVAKHAEDYEGLCLLASYSTEDLSDSGLRVLSVTATEDRVLNWEKYTEALGNLPDNATYAELEGGCHGQFGSYGPQKGDGIPTISGEEQTVLTADAMAALMTP